MNRPRIATVILLLVVGCADATSPTIETESSTSSLPATTSTSSPDSTSSTTPPTTTGTLPADQLSIESFPVPSGSRPHDVAPTADGGVWYTAQNLGELGWLDPVTGETRHLTLGAGSRPHGVIVDAEGTPWITDGGLNAIVSVDPGSEEITVYPLPEGSPDANLNTATFDDEGNLWFTGQNGIYGRLDVDGGDIEVFEAPEGRGPYGITTTPQGDVFYASLAGSHVGAISADGSVVVIEPLTPNQGARRVWADSTGAVWVSEWNAGSLSRYDPDSGAWETWKLPGDNPMAYAVFVDDADIVWVSDFGSNSMVRFDPVTEMFSVYPLPHDPGDVRQIHGRPGEVWGAESAADHLVLIRTR